ncbi:hypothetical protein AB205_0058520 [Aquarana catesbeiana]|uniref:Secreted protein n=1 Tax=Aquarana catesbeiana TaxID=8400 RepID=A0A2G9R8A8_AQUCT|nr:hypothetical protein AB205_0058520 [Aquarana catesbeiana]
MLCFIFLFLASKYTYFFYIGEKRLGGHHSSEETTDHPPQEEGEIPQTQPEEEVGDVVEIVTTTEKPNSEDAHTHKTRPLIPHDGS